MVTVWVLVALRLSEVEELELMALEVGEIEVSVLRVEVSRVEVMVVRVTVTVAEVVEVSVESVVHVVVFRALVDNYQSLFLCNRQKETRV